MNAVKTQLSCPDCGHPLIEIGCTANSYEAQPNVPVARAWSTHSCDRFMTRGESEASDA